MPTKSHHRTPAELADLPDEALITAKEGQEYTHSSNSSWYRWIQQELIPPGISIGRQARRWRMGDVRKLVQREEAA